MAKIMFGTRVRIKRKKSIKHFAVNNMTIDGTVIDIDKNHYDGQSRRPYLVLFQDGRSSWWRKNELAVKKETSDG